MKTLSIMAVLPLVLNSCAAMPEFLKTADDVLTDGVIQVQIDKEAFGKETDIEVNITIKNKEPVK